MIAILTILFSLLVTWFLIEPHLRPAVDSLDKNEDLLLDHKARCVQILRDLELDYSTEKISSEDYEKTRLTLEEELALILRELDKRAKI